jgi:serine/threonine-protein kinase
MSPEQSRGKPTDHRSDLFSFGSLLFEMIGGHTAFHRETVSDTFTAIMEEELPPLSKLGIAIPPRMQKLLNGLLEKSVDARIQSADQIVTELDAIARAPAVAAASRGSASRLLILAIGFATLAAIVFLLVRSFK